MKGSFITFEGCEGVGKTTQVEKLRRYLEESGQRALFLREPVGQLSPKRYPKRFVCIDASKDAEGVWRDVIAVIRKKTGVK